MNTAVCRSDDAAVGEGRLTPRWVSIAGFVGRIRAGSFPTKSSKRALFYGGPLACGMPSGRVEFRRMFSIAHLHRNGFGVTLVDPAILQGGWS